MRRLANVLILGTILALSALPTCADGFLQYHPITPCRLADTRLPAHAPALVGSPTVTRSFLIQGLCGVPVGAKAVSLNVTITQPSGGGYLTFFPGASSEPTPTVSTINFNPGDTLANGAIVPLGPSAPLPNADLRVRAGMAGTVHLILDVSGYFQ